MSWAWCSKCKASHGPGPCPEPKSWFDGREGKPAAAPTAEQASKAERIAKARQVMQQAGKGKRVSPKRAAQALASPSASVATHPTPSASARAAGKLSADGLTIQAPCPCGCGQVIDWRPSWPEPKASHRSRAYRARRKEDGQ